MRLATIRVTNFRSIDDTDEFDLGQVLCRVGKNEAGKTAVIQALAGLNPHPSTPISYDLERDFPRRRFTDYKKLHDKEHATVVSTSWKLSDDEQTAIADKIGPKTLSGDSCRVYRRYEDKEPQWEFPIDCKIGVLHLFDEEHLTKTEKEQLSKATTSDELRKALEAIEQPTDRQKRLLDRLNALPGKNFMGLVKSILRPALPQFMYFSHYDRMQGQIRLDTYKSRLAGNLAPKVEMGEEIFVDFLEYAGTSLEEINLATTYESLNARCEAASNNITQQLLEYWTQNPYLEVEVRVTKAEPNDPAPFNQGTIARARVKNTIHKASVPFSERSAGFI